MLTPLIALATHLGPWLYVLVGLLAFGESAVLLGMVLPGETALLVAGYFCHQGVISLWVMIPIAVAAAVAGDSVGFEVGRRYGVRLRGSRLGSRIGDRRWARADQFLMRRGGTAILAARFTAVLRALTPTMAGASGMPYRTFLGWNALGGLLWGAGCVLVGALFGSALSSAGHYLTWAPPAILLLVAGTALLVHRRRGWPTELPVPDAPAADGRAPTLTGSGR